MKASQKDFKAQAAKAARTAQVFYFCGPDEAGAHDAAHTIAALLPDPGERIELTGAELKRDPVRLGDEARSISLFGDKRHIWSVPVATRRTMRSPTCSKAQVRPARC